MVRSGSTTEDRSMHARLKALLICLSSLITTTASAYELMIDQRLYRIDIESPSHSLGSATRSIALPDAELMQCRRYADGSAPSLRGIFDIRYGSAGGIFSTDEAISLQLVPFRYSVTTIDGDLVCLPYLPSPVFGDGFEQ